MYIQVKVSGKWRRVQVGIIRYVGKHTEVWSAHTERGRFLGTFRCQEGNFETRLTRLVRGNF